MTIVTTAINIPGIPKPGEIWFSINLHYIDDVPGLYAVLKGLSLPPQLAYRQTGDGIEMHLLLAHLTNMHQPKPIDDLFWEEQKVLADLIPTEAISFRSGLHLSLMPA